MPIADYIFIFLVLLTILLFYLAIRYFKFLFFYLWVTLWILLWTYWKVFLEDKNFNLWLLNYFLDNIKHFFSDSIIVWFLWDNLVYLFIIFIIALFHRFFYYLSIILLYFVKWFSTGILTWVSNRKERKATANISESNIWENINNELKK